MAVTDAQFSGLSGDVAALELSVLDNERLILGLPSKNDFDNFQTYSSQEFNNLTSILAALSSKVNTMVGYMQNLKSSHVNLTTVVSTHTALSGEHIDWTQSGAGTIDPSNYI